MESATNTTYVFAFTPANIVWCSFGPLLILEIVIGNFMVILAVIREKALHVHYSNWYIVSLAFADFLVGLLIMPLSLAYEITGIWIFGSVTCEAWLALDVLFVTASIMNLCVIAVDRFWSISDAVGCHQKRTKTFVIKRIAFVWFGSLAIACPPLIGWRPSRPPKRCDLRFSIVSCVAMGDVVANFSDLGYVLYSASGSFYIPAIILLVVYAKIFTHTRNRRKQKLDELRVKVERLTVLAEREGSHRFFGSSEIGQWLSHAISNAGSGKRTRSVALRNYNSLKYKTDTPTHPDDTAGTSTRNQLTVNGSNKRDAVPDDRSRTSELLITNTGAAVLFPMVSCAANKPCSNITQDVEVPKQAESGCFELKDERLKVQNKQKRLRRRDRKLNFILGLVVLAFMVCWGPFFIMYLLPTVGVFPPDVIFKIVFWLGYCNSGLNPIIYALFNVHFRKAFIKMFVVNSD